MVFKTNHTIVYVLHYNYIDSSNLHKHPGRDAPPNHYHPKFPIELDGCDASNLRHCHLEELRLDDDSGIMAIHSFFFQN